MVRRKNGDDLLNIVAWIKTPGTCIQPLFISFSGQTRQIRASICDSTKMLNMLAFVIWTSIAHKGIFGRICVKYLPVRNYENHEEAYELGVIHACMYIHGYSVILSLVCELFPLK